MTYGSDWTPAVKVVPSRRQKSVFNETGEGTAMEDLPENQNTQAVVMCRRRARRQPLAVEAELSRNGLTWAAVIRDVSSSEDERTELMGIGLFHHDALPLDEILNCRTISRSELLPVESTVTLIWTRRFGSDGFLSGGKMSGTEMMSDEDSDKSGFKILTGECD
jgi:hypothetical protein